jgi:hypothetical protein
VATTVKLRGAAGDGTAVDDEVDAGGGGSVFAQAATSSSERSPARQRSTGES